MISLGLLLLVIAFLCASRLQQRSWRHRSSSREIRRSAASFPMGATSPETRTDQAGN